MGVKWTREQMAGTKAGTNLFGDSLTKDENRKAKTKRSREAANAHQKWCIDYLNDTSEFEVHRNNNIPSTTISEKVNEDGTKETKVFHRKNLIKKTVLDITGFRTFDGLHIEIEVKWGNDTLSKDQRTRLDLLQKAGAMAFVASNDKQVFKKQVEPYRKPYKPAF